MKDKRLLLFDLDGTLIDSVPDLTSSIDFMMQKLGKKGYGEEIVREWVGEGAKKLVQRALQKEDVDRELEIFLDHYSKNLCIHTKLFTDVETTLKELKSRGFTLAIVTNKPHIFVKEILERLEIFYLFDEFLGAGIVKEKKPSPKPLLHICEKLGFSPDEAVMVGDSKSDILSAKRANILSIAVTYGYNHGVSVKEYEPDIIIDNFSQILPYLIRPKIAVIGAGVAGSTISLLLSQIECDIDIFEKEPSPISGPPMCHLHSGGNLYREISNDQCLTLLRQSIDFVKLYPLSIDFRPTILITPVDDKDSPKNLIPRLELLQKEYERLIKEDPSNRVLGDAKNYYKIYEKEDIEKLKDLPIPRDPKNFDEWMVPVLKYVDLNRVKFPIIAVEEYGINLFNLSAMAEIGLKDKKNITLHLNRPITNIKKERFGWILNDRYRVDYLINAAGYKTGEIDDKLNLKRDRFVEFKAAYITKWRDDIKFPEVIFHGERGTPKAMAQFTPYNGGYYQIHGMTKDITLFEDGLAKSDITSSEPKLPKRFYKKIKDDWKSEDIEIRTDRAISHTARFIPLFKSAKVGAKPLYGAQQIPGIDPTLRAADVSFEDIRYARVEIVKASSAIDSAFEIAKKLKKCGYIDDLYIDLSILQNLDKKEVKNRAREIAKERGYPVEMALLYNPLKS
jgi:2-phosphoglycolate phosphatase